MDRRQSLPKDQTLSIIPAPKFARFDLESEPGLIQQSVSPKMRKVKKVNHVRNSSLDVIRDRKKLVS